MDVQETKQAIEAMPDNGRLALNPTAVYESDEWGMNRHLTIRTDSDVEIADLKALAADHTRLAEAKRSEKDAVRAFIAEVKDSLAKLCPKQHETIKLALDLVFNERYGEEGK